MLAWAHWKLWHCRMEFWEKSPGGQAFPTAEAIELGSNNGELMQFDPVGSILRLISTVVTVASNSSSHFLYLLYGLSL